MVSVDLKPIPVPSLIAGTYYRRHFNGIGARINA